MSETTYPQTEEWLRAHRDTMPLPFAKLARRLAQLQLDQTYRITLWFDGDNPRWVIEAMGKAEGCK